MIRNLLLAAAATLIALLLGEAAVRLIRPQIFPVHPPGMYVADPNVGYALAPGFQGRLERAEFSAPFSVGPSGLRGEDGDRDRAALRILALGDSQTFGFGVRDGETYAAVLERLLRERTGRPVEVLNAGVPGYGTADQRNFLVSRWEALRPDIVILQFLPVNDFVESRYPAVDWAAIVDGRLGNRANAPAADPTLFQRLRRWQKRHSHLATLLSENLGYLAMRMGLMHGGAGLLGEDFTPEDAARVEGLLAEIADFARARGAPTMLLYATSKADVIGGRYEPRPSRDAIAVAADAAGIPWTDANTFLRAHPDRLETYWRLDGHWTAAGHRAIAELLAHELERRRWLDARRP